MTEHWIHGWVWDRAKEVPRAVAETHERYARVWRRGDGSIDRSELYRRGQLVEVVYRDGRNDEEIAALHAHDHPYVRRQQMRTIARTGPYDWVQTRVFDEHGALAERAIMLIGADDREVMQIDLGDDGPPARITKYYWSDSDTLRFVFEYGADGKSVGYVFDVAENDHADIDYLATELPDWQFYADGWALPAPIAGTPIPDVDG